MEKNHCSALLSFNYFICLSGCGGGWQGWSPYPVPALHHHLEPGGHIGLSKSLIVVINYSFFPTLPPFFPCLECCKACCSGWTDVLGCRHKSPEKNFKKGKALAIVINNVVELIYNRTFFFDLANLVSIVVAVVTVGVVLLPLR